MIFPFMETPRLWKPPYYLKDIQTEKPGQIQGIQGSSASTTPHHSTAQLDVGSACEAPMSRAPLEKEHMSYDQCDTCWKPRRPSFPDFPCLDGSPPNQWAFLSPTLPPPLRGLRCKDCQTALWGARSPFRGLWDKETHQYGHELQASRYSS